MFRISSFCAALNDDKGVEDDSPCLQKVKDVIHHFFPQKKNTSFYTFERTSYCSTENNPLQDHSGVLERENLLSLASRIFYHFGHLSISSCIDKLMSAKMFIEMLDFYLSFINSFLHM